MSQPISMFHGLAAWLALATLLPAGAGAQSVAPSAPEIEARAHLLADFHSGRILVESNADEPLEPASLTKMMTTYVVFAEIKAGNLALDDKVRISEKAWRMPGSRMFVEVDTEVTVEDLLLGVIVQSGNDSSVAIAEHVAGDETAFADLMNRHARRLGMHGSNFTNASGLPEPEHYTSARDMATMAIALIRDFPELYLMHKIKSFEFNGIEQRNRNRLLWQDDSVDGLKTGYTKSAGYCLVASAERDDMRLVSVIMGTDSVKSRLRYSQALLRYGFRFFETHRLYAAHEPVERVRIWKGSAERLGLGLEADLYVTVPRGQYKNLQARMEVDTRLMAPVAKGEPKGTLSVTLDGEEVASRPVVALATVRKGNLWQQVSDHVRLMFE